MGIDNVEQIRKMRKLPRPLPSETSPSPLPRRRRSPTPSKLRRKKKIAEQNAALSVQQAQMRVMADTKKAEADAASPSSRRVSGRPLKLPRPTPTLPGGKKEAELAEKEIALRERKLDAEIRKAGRRHEVQGGEGSGGPAHSPPAGSRSPEIRSPAAGGSPEGGGGGPALSMEQEAEGIRAKGWPRQRPLRRRQKPKSEWVKPPFWKCTWQPCRKWSKTPPLPLSQTEKIVMYGDGNSTKLVRDIIASANQVADGMRESTGIDLQALIAGFAGGKAAQEAEIG